LACNQLRKLTTGLSRRILNRAQLARKVYLRTIGRLIVRNRQPSLPTARVCGLHFGRDWWWEGYAKLFGSRLGEFPIDLGLLFKTASQSQILFLLCDAIKMPSLFKILRYQPH
jgi:hypothetical protein